MKRFAKLLAVAGVIFALSIVAAYALIESGEVVVLRASPEDGSEFLARLWVVDHDGRPWISTTDPSATDWVPWLRTHAAVLLDRDGVVSCRRATFDHPERARDRLNRLLTKKYRVQSYGSWLLKLLGGARNDAGARVWIRLDPCGAS